MKDRARCRNCGHVSFRFKTITLPQAAVTLDNVHERRTGPAPTAIVCRDVIKCRERYDRKAAALKRHNDHVSYMRALKGRAS